MHRIRKHLLKKTQRRQKQNNENTKEKDMYEEVHILFFLIKIPAELLLEKTRCARKMRSSRRGIYCFAVRSRAECVQHTLFERKGK